MNRTTSSVVGPDESWDPLSFLDRGDLNTLIETRKRQQQEPVTNTTLYTNSDSNEAKDSSCTNQQSVFLKTDCVSEASGSSYIELGNTKLLVSVYGPRLAIISIARIRFKGHNSTPITHPG